VSTSALTAGNATLAPLNVRSNVIVICTHPTPYDVSVNFTDDAAPSLTRLESELAVSNFGTYWLSHMKLGLDLHVMHITNFASGLITTATASQVHFAPACSEQAFSTTAKDPGVVTVVVTY
jgi:hypothetical protein